MGEFGAGVSALLETYGKCLSLLKGSRGQSRPPSDDASAAAADARSQLRASIRSDRSRVRAAYTARLYREGSRLSRGDSQSRSKLNRILDKLKGAIRSILDVTKTQHPEIDYASLISLSNSSRADAIRTMDDLSRRLNKPSSSSLARTRKSASPSTSSSSSKSKSKPKDAQGYKDAKRKTRAREPESKKNDKVKDSGHHHRKATKTGKAMQKPDSTSSSSSSHPSASKQRRPTGSAKQRREAEADADDRVGALPHTSAAASSSSSSSSPAPRKLRKPPAGANAPNRISYVSTSTDSTKLGEIPLRRSRLAWNPDTGDFEYGFRPVYPLHAPIRPAPAEERAPGFFRRVFGGGGGGAAREKG